MRVFRTLLSKGLCSGETEETEGDGDGNIDGMKVCEKCFLRSCVIVFANDSFCMRFDRATVIKPSSYDLTVPVWLCLLSAVR